MWLRGHRHASVNELGSLGAPPHEPIPGDAVPEQWRTPSGPPAAIGSSARSPVAPAEQEKEGAVQGHAGERRALRREVFPVQKMFGTGKNEPMDIAIPPRSLG